MLNEVRIFELRFSYSYLNSNAANSISIVCMCVYAVLYGLLNWVSCVHSLCVCICTQFCMVCSTGYHVFIVCVCMYAVLYGLLN